MGWETGWLIGLGRPDDATPSLIIQVTKSYRILQYYQDVVGLRQFDSGAAEGNLPAGGDNVGYTSLTRHMAKPITRDGGRVAQW